MFEYHFACCPHQNTDLHSLQMTRLAFLIGALTMTGQFGPGQNLNSGWL